MYNKRGFTLVELIVAIALLGLLGVVFLPSISSAVKWMGSTRINISQETFKSQDVMELQINSVKNALALGEDLEVGGVYKYGIVDKLDDVRLFKTDFNKTERVKPEAYKIRVSIDNKREWFTLVGNKRLPELLVPEIIAEDLLLVRNTIESPQKFEYYNFINLELKALANMITNPDNSFNRYRHDWYVSRPGFLIPAPHKDFINQDYDFGRIYPSFPDDFDAIPIQSDLGRDYSYVNEDNRDISITLSNNMVRQFPGKHIVYTITPFSKALKKGNEALSMPVYIYGPTVTNNLLLHLDASTADVNDKYNSSTNRYGSIVKDSIENGIYLRNWKSNRPDTKNINSNLSAVQVNQSNMPVFRVSSLSDVYLTPEIPFQGDLYDEDDPPRVWGRALANQGETDLISNMEIDNFPLASKWTLFTIIKMVDYPMGPKPYKNIIETTASGYNRRNWALSWTNDDNPGLDFVVNNDYENNYFYMDDSLVDDQWYMLVLKVNGNDLYMKAINLTNGSEHVISGAKTIQSTTNSSNLIINWNGIELAELLIYDSSLDSDSMLEVENFLINKYNP